MRIMFMTNEYPPHIYGGAGVHVEYLSKELAKLTPVEVRSFHDQTFDDGQLTVRGTKVDATHFAGCPAPLVSPLRALAHLPRLQRPGHRRRQSSTATPGTRISAASSRRFSTASPLVITVHSLEPLRPWKREQIGRGYDLSSWIEKTALEMADAVIAVSNSTARRHSAPVRRRPGEGAHHPQRHRHRRIPAGQTARRCSTRFGIDPARPYVLFVGRMTRQKGLLYLLQAIDAASIPRCRSCCAPANPTRRRCRRNSRRWCEELKLAGRASSGFRRCSTGRDTIALYSHATVFCCPSIYEPFGIINLEAMACDTPVVGSAVGGIPEVVVDGETGFLVDAGLVAEPPHDPVDPDRFARGLAEAINRLARDPELARSDGRSRAEAGGGTLQLAQHCQADPRPLQDARRSARLAHGRHPGAAIARRRTPAGRSIKQSKGR